MVRSSTTNKIFLFSLPSETPRALFQITGSLHSLGCFQYSSSVNGRGPSPSLSLPPRFRIKDIVRLGLGLGCYGSMVNIFPSNAIWKQSPTCEALIAS